MQLVIISGRSGSGKSIALQALEDLGYYAIDNLPAMLLDSLIDELRDQGNAPIWRLALMRAICRARLLSFPSFSKSFANVPSSVRLYI